MPKLILCRHGQSEWNAKNLFTGWEDVNLSEQGINEATRAGEKVEKIHCHRCSFYIVINTCFRYNALYFN